LIPLKDGEVLMAVYQEAPSSPSNPEQITKTDYTPMKMIGKGGFSRVSMVRRKSDGMIFAMKIMSKEFL
jgi:hypothetical protein